MSLALPLCNAWLTRTIAESRVLSRISALGVNAREMPAQQNAIRRLRLNEWTEQVTRWIDMDVWAEGAAPVDEEELVGRCCYAGLDLARVNDLSSLALVFPPQHEGEAVKIIWRHWCPQDDILRRSRRDRAPYTIWRDQGLLMATEGNTTDFKFIEAEILALAARFVVTELAYDRTFAGEIVRNLQDEGLSLVEFGQGFLSMGPASAEFLRLLIGRELQHGGNPIATWCASNVSVRKDPAGNEKPDKERSTEKIDAIVAAVMAVGRMQAGGQGARSVYESIAAAAAAFRKESGNTTGAASLRGIGDGWGQFGDSWDQFDD